MKEKLQFIIEGASVVRYHTRPGIRQETDGHHSHEVAMLCSFLVWGDTGNAPLNVHLIMAGLTHDLAEQKASDVSAPSKRDLGISAKLHNYEREALNFYKLDHESMLNASEKRTLKMADMLSLMLYCVRELSLGNRNVMLIWQRAVSYIDTFKEGKPLLPNEQIVYDAILEIFTEVTSFQGPQYDVFKRT